MLIFITDEEIYVYNLKPEEYRKAKEQKPYTIQR